MERRKGKRGGSRARCKGGKSSTQSLKPRQGGPRRKPSVLPFAVLGTQSNMYLGSLSTAVRLEVTDGTESLPARPLADPPYRQLLTEGSQLQALTTGVVPQGTPARPPWTSQAD